MGSTTFKSSTKILRRYTRSEKNRASIKIQIRDDYRERRGEIPCDLWGIIQTMTDSFPFEPADVVNDADFYSGLEETLDKVNSCFMVFKCRYNNYNIRGELPVVYRIFEQIVGLLERALGSLKEAREHLYDRSCGNDNCNCIEEVFRGKGDIFNNLILIMTEGTAYKESTLSNEWIQKINVALHSDDRGTDPLYDLFYSTLD